MYKGLSLVSSLILLSSILLMGASFVRVVIITELVGSISCYCFSMKRQQIMGRKQQSQKDYIFIFIYVFIYFYFQ